MPDTAYALIFCERKILLFHRDDIPTIPNPDTWALPGGVIEIDESPLQAINRELVEEISYKPRKLQFIGKFKKDTGYFLYLYLAYVNEADEAKFKLGPGEGQEISFFSIDEVLKLKLAPGVRKLSEKNYDELVDSIKNNRRPKLNL